MRNYLYSLEILIAWMEKSHTTYIRKTTQKKTKSTNKLDSNVSGISSVFRNDKTAAAACGTFNIKSPYAIWAKYTLGKLKPEKKNTTTKKKRKCDDVLTIQDFATFNNRCYVVHAKFHLKVGHSVGGGRESEWGIKGLWKRVVRAVQGNFRWQDSRS